MAGLGSRFSSAGYSMPKPFIDIEGLPMISRVLKNLEIKDAKFYLICQNQHLINFKSIINEIRSSFNVEFIGIEGLTEGTACTVLYAKKYIDNDHPLLIANSDQIVDINIIDFINDSAVRKLDGSILCFKDYDLNPKWSFAKLNSSNLVCEVKEKEPISDNATVGIYLFSKGKFFVDSAIEMIIRNDRVNNEFYTCPVYNYLIQENYKIGIYEIDFSQMHGIGTPNDLKIYIEKKFKS